MSAAEKIGTPTPRRELVAANEPMAPGDAILSEVRLLRASFDALAAEVASLRAGAAAPRTPHLLSMREAARALRVSRTRTLPSLIRDHGIRIVDVNGRPRISSDEIERVCREGASSPLNPGKAKRVARSRPGAPLARSLV